MKLRMIAAVLLLSGNCLAYGFGSAGKPGKNIQVLADTVKKDSVKKENKIKPYKEVITAEAVSQRGMFGVHRVADRWFFEIPDSLLDREMLQVTRISKAPPSVLLRATGGDEASKNVLSFSRVPGNKLVMKRITFYAKASDGEGGMQAALDKSNLQPIRFAFEIKALNEGTKSTVIDVTDLLNSDNDFLFISKWNVMANGWSPIDGGYQADKSYIESIRAYKKNVEIQTVKTFLKNGTTTVGLNTSIVLLPTQLAAPRMYNERVGYFAGGYYDYNANAPVKAKYLINRWKLEPKAEDIEKYKRGELVEPEKPIVYYIDPATPKKWIPYLMQGVNDWQKAFEKAGFTNAIRAEEAPKDDSTWSIDDASHSVIVYKASEVQNASGPQIVDPRTGETLETHINWYHNIMQLMHDWYMIQAGPLDTGARAVNFDDALMGRLIRYVCAHEVGHTLGLRHNFLSSALVPVDSLRSVSYVRGNGTCPSIMDYARFNYVAQPGDGMTREDLIPRIGAYDEWAIEWGYRWFPDGKGDEKYMGDWAQQKIQSDKRLRFGVETLSLVNMDPKRQSEDLGDDAVKAGNYGIENLKRVLAQAETFTKNPNGDYQDLYRIQGEIWEQYYRYITHVRMIIGGVEWSPRYAGDQTSSIRYPGHESQSRAVDFLIKQLFNNSGWITRDPSLLKTIKDPSFDAAGPIENLNLLQRVVLTQMTNLKSIRNIIISASYSPNDHYSPAELFSTLQGSFFSELRGTKPITMARRQLQMTWVERLIELSGGLYAAKNIYDAEAYSLSITTTDVYPLIHAKQRELLALVKTSLSAYKDPVVQLHLRDMKDRLSRAIEAQTNNWLLVKPGSPVLNGFAGKMAPTDEMITAPGANEKCWFGTSNIRLLK